MHFSSQKAVAIFFPADGTILNFFFLEDCVWCHWVTCYLDLGVSWWAQVLSSMTVYKRKQLLSLPLCLLLSAFMAPSEHILERSMLSAGKILASVIWNEKGITLVNFLCGGTAVISDYYSKMSRKMSECSIVLSLSKLPPFSPHQKVACMRMLVHTQVCSPLRPWKNLDVQCFCIQPIVLTLNLQIFTCLII